MPGDQTISVVIDRPIVAGAGSISLTDAAGASIPGTTTVDAASRTLTFTPNASLPARRE